MEFLESKCYIQSIFTLFVLFLNSVMLIILRAQYSIDVISGIVFGHYLWIMANHYLTLNIYSKQTLEPSKWPQEFLTKI